MGIGSTLKKAVGGGPLGAVGAMVNPTALLGTALGGGDSLLGAHSAKMANKSAASRAREQMAFEASQAEIARKWSTGERESAQGFAERMANTQMQRKMVRS